MKQVNEATQDRNMSHVTNLTCGISTSNRDVDYHRCPGNLECYNIGEYDPGEEQEARCVEPEYLEDFCGRHANTMILESFPPKIDCSPQYRIGDIIQNILTPLTRPMFSLAYRFS